jgi:DNA-binding transcriptional LysR family regulator
MDRLEAMSLLIAAVESGSLSAASRKLNIPLPTVSRKVAELEEHLKTRLLTRSTRKLTLTDAGAAYLSACKVILEYVDDAESQVSGEFIAPRGELILTAPIVFGRLHLLSVVNTFLDDYPDINVRMMLFDRTVNLAEDHVDMAIRLGNLPDSSVIATRVGSVRRVICGSPDYFKENGIPKSPADLGGLTCVTFSALASGSSWTFPTSGKSNAQPVRPRCRLNINTAESAIDAAVAGIGVTHVLSYQVAQYVAEGKLQVVLEDFEPEPVPVHLMHAAQGRLPLKMRRFLDFAAPRLRKSLLADEASLAQGAELAKKRSKDKKKAKVKQKTAAV